MFLFSCLMMSQKEVPCQWILEKGMSSCEGMGSESRVPSGRMGLACSPLVQSNLFLLRMIFMGGIWCFVGSNGWQSRLG